MNIFISHLGFNLLAILLGISLSMVISRGSRKILIPRTVFAWIFSSFFFGYFLLIPTNFNIGFFIQFSFLAVSSSLFLTHDKNHYDDYLDTWFNTPILSPLILILIFSTTYFFTSSNIWNGVEVGNRIQDIVIEKDQNAIDSFYIDVNNGEVRKITKETAISLAKKTLSKSIEEGVTLGSALEVETSYVNIEEINGTDYWIIPLGYQSYWKQDSYGSVNAYVKINASDSNAKEELIFKNVDGETFNMDISLGAFFDKNYSRVFRNEFPDAIVSSHRFLVDDSLNPYIGTYVIEPVVGAGSYVTKSLVVYDFRTKEFTTYEKAEELPEWIEIFHDINVVESEFNDWGDLRKGFKESIGSTFAKELTDSSDNNMVFVKTKNGRAWFSGVTSKSGTNNSMTDLLFVDTLTGQPTMIRFEGSDEKGIIKAVQGRLGINADKWTPKMPIIYQHSDNEEKIWILPITHNSTNLVQGYAVVDSKNIKKIAIEDSLESALRSYSRLGGFEQKIISEKEIIKIEGLITVFNLVNRDNSITAYILSSDNENIIECQADTNPECLVMAVGQEISAEAYSFDENQLRIKSITKGGNKK